MYQYYDRLLNVGGQRDRRKDIYITLNVELIPTCNLLALLGAHHILHIGRIRVKITVAFHSFGSYFKLGSTSTEYLRIFRQFRRHSSWYTLMSVSNKQLYTRSVGWHKLVASRRPQFIHHAGGQSFQIPLQYCVVKFSLRYCHFYHDTSK